MTRISIKIAAICDWIGSRLYALAARFWSRSRRIRIRQATRASMTETEERMWERASVEAGYAPLPEYIERHGSDKVVTISASGYELAKRMAAEGVE